MGATKSLPKHVAALRELLVVGQFVAFRSAKGGPFRGAKGDLTGICEKKAWTCHFSPAGSRITPGPWGLIGAPSFFPILGRFVRMVIMSWTTIPQLLEQVRDPEDETAWNRFVEKY